MSATVAEVRAILSADASSMVRGLGQAKSATRELQAEVTRTNSALQTVRGATEGAGAAMRGVSGAADRASSGLRDVANSARSAESQTRLFNNAAQQSQGHLSGMTSMLGKAAFAVGGLFTAMAGYKVFNFAKDAVFGFNSTLQGAQMQMGRMLKSDVAAAGFIEDLKKFAIQTPFQFEDLIKASQQFLVYGWKVEDIIPDMEAIGSAAMGDAYKIDMITRALGQMRAKGKVSSEEISMQLGESGIPGWRYVAEAFGVTIPEAMKLAEKGALDVETAIQAILGGMRRDFGGGMEAASKTFQGAMSNVKDAAQQALAVGFRPLFDSVSGGLLKLANLMMGERFQNAIKAMTGIAERFAKPLTDFIDKIIAKLETLDPMKAVSGFERLTGSLTGLKDIAGPLIGVLAGLKLAGGAGGMIGFLGGAIMSSNEGRDAMKALAEAMAEVAKVVGPDLAQALSRITPALVAVSQVVSSLVVAFSKLPKPLQEMVILAGIGGAAFQKFGSPLKAIAGLLSPFSLGMKRAAVEVEVLGNEALAAEAKLGGLQGRLSGLRSGVSTFAAGAGRGALVGGIGATAVGMAGGGTGAQVGGMAGGVIGGGIGAFFGGIGAVPGAILGTGIGTVLGTIYDEFFASTDKAIDRTKEFEREWKTMVRNVAENQVPAMMNIIAAPEVPANLLGDGKMEPGSFGQAQNTAISNIISQSENFPKIQKRLDTLGITYLEFIQAISTRGSLTTWEDLRAVSNTLGISIDTLTNIMTNVPELAPSLDASRERIVAAALATGDLTTISRALDGSLGLVDRRLNDLRESAAAYYKGDVYDGIIQTKAIKNATQAFADAAQMTAVRVWRASGSITAAESAASDLRKTLSDHLVGSLKLSREEADRLAATLIKMPTEKIIRLQLKADNFTGAADTAIQSYKDKIAALEGWFGAQGMEVPEALKAEAWQSLAPAVDKIIDEMVKAAGSNRAAVYQLEVLKFMYPELAEVATSKINWILNSYKALGTGSLSELERIKQGHAELAPSITAIEAEIIANKLAHADTKKSMLANIEELKAKFDGPGNESLRGALDRLKTIIESMDGKKININAILKAFKDPSWSALESQTGIGITVNGQPIAPTPVPEWFTTDPNNPKGLAKGGSVSANTPYIVGEVGPELFMPNRSGTIIPNDALNKMRSNPSISAPPFSGMTPVGTTPWDNGGQAGPTGKYVHIENLNVTNAQPNEAANAIVRRLRTEAFLAGN